MNRFLRCGVAPAAALLLALVAGSARAAPAASPSACNDAWGAYNDFKSRTAMAPSQYPLTIQGAAVRAACGKDALPAPPNADQPPRHHIRRQGTSMKPPGAPLAPSPGRRQADPFKA
jgi:hypothetical protein